jgi:hypothetical protein
MPAMTRDEALQALGQATGRRGRRSNLTDEEKRERQKAMVRATQRASAALRRRHEEEFRVLRETALQEELAKANGDQPVSEDDSDAGSEPTESYEDEYASA